VVLHILQQRTFENLEMMPLFCFFIFMIIIDINNSYFRGLSRHTASLCMMCTESQANCVNRLSSLKTALLNLQQYNDECRNYYCNIWLRVFECILFPFHLDLIRMKTARAEGKAPKLVEFARAQQLKADGIQREWTMLRESILVVKNFSSQIVLGIMADSGNKGVDSLKSWVNGLGLPRGILHAVDKNNQRLQLEAATDMLSMFQSVPVYIKYNSSEGGHSNHNTTIGGDAYMKPFEGSFTGVIFQPKILNDETFYQFGNIPSAIFK
jgi:hypothetical protein